jgi:hypothetical protein
VDQKDLNDIVDFCINKNFKNNSIKYVKNLNTFNLPPNFSVWDIRESNVSLIKKQINQFDEFRLSHFVNLLKETAHKIKDINCKIILNLGDEPHTDYKYSSLCFSCPQDSSHIPIPDPHIFKYINNKEYLFESFDNKKFSDKKSSGCFRGSDTGQISDDLLNQRVSFCNKFKNSDIIDAKITAFHHFNSAMLSDLGININEISSDFSSHQEQLQHKYIIDICGNTAAWDRIAWVTASNSILVKIKSNECLDQCWYWPYIKQNSIVPEIKMEKIEKYLSENLNGQDELNGRQKLTAQNLLLNRDFHLKYFEKTLIKYNNLYNQ